jgi:hypothetical protein
VRVQSTCGALDGLSGPEARDLLSRQPIHEQGRIGIKVLDSRVVRAAAPRCLEGCPKETAMVKHRARSG